MGNGEYVPQRRASRARYDPDAARKSRELALSLRRHQTFARQLRDRELDRLPPESVAGCFNSPDP